MYRVVITPYYFAGTIGAPQRQYATDSSGNILEWATEEEAQEWIDEHDGPYVLSHGEYAAPQYEIVDDAVVEESDCVDHDDSDAFWELVPRDKLPAGIADVLDKANVEYSHDDGDHQIWSAVITDKNNDTQYRITYCVSALAIQRNADDLSGVAWDKPSYYVSR